MKTGFAKSLLASALIATMAISGAVGAEVPEGTKLHKEQKLIRNNGAEPQSLDPHKIEGVPEANLARDQFEGLVNIDLNGEIRPGVAESWENDDYRVWRFNLRKDAKWSNGDPVTAEDFVYSWKRLVDPNTASPYASYLQYAHVENVDDIVNGKADPDTLGVRALDDHTFEITLSEPIPYIDKLVGHTSTVPVHRATVEKYGNQWTAPGNFVSNGAYKLKDWVVNERIVLQRNDQYWDNDKTVIDEVTFLAIPSEVTDVNRYRSGEVDMTNNAIPVDLFSRLQRDIPDEVKISPSLCTYYYEINNEQAPFDDARVRVAVKLALDRDIIANKVMGQGQTPAFGFTPPSTVDMEAIEPEWFQLTQKERNEKAKQLLADAGYGPGNPLSFTLLYNTSEAHRKVAIAAASILKQNAGIEVKLENQEWKTFLDSRHQGNYEVARAGWCADYNEPSSFLNIMLSTSSNNTSHYKSDAFDVAMRKSITAATEDDRVKAYQEAERILDEDSAIVPIYYYVSPRLVKPYVGGYSVNNPLGYAYTKDMYIIEH
ncbi:ABC transporter substrate-binding protein [Ignatzschineria cameli]|uniref:Oligopeptide ABC transporter substrate-binding protein OppA n=1 Tax=Ignatzschineria cameli TaxID=2182793 RepID=A0ABX5L657_9GAMM|nr:ABC transporter substrate-binding protein [Ignatzschineria cameli]PWD91280.1 oligopeptide ABC transporter substrate-binding protein OppA [Ignatzschineria cameli]PWD92921.1 oligopeptide ABC transporter substrate-binding protein OppA [Ignatzschineria cameli]PWD93942.1 oligopeptide ABC transporter substrate-binding protein OppA [Ignatzschineria cameli]